MVSHKYVPIHPYELKKKWAWALYYYSKGDSPKKIAKRLNTTYSSIRKLIYRLRKRGYLNSGNILSPTGEALVEQYVVGSHNVPLANVPETVRLHHLSLKVPVNEKGWDKKREAVTTIELTEYKEWRINGGFQQSFRLNQHVGVRTTPKSVILIFSDIYASTPQLAKDNAMKLFEKSLGRVNQIFNLKLNPKGRLDLRVSSQEIAFIYDEIAKFFLREGLTLRIYNEVGELIWMGDDSHGLAELEAVHQKWAEEHGESFKGLLRDISLKPSLLPSELTTQLKSVQTKADRLQKAYEEQAQFNKELVDTLITFSQQAPQETTGGWN